MAVKCGHQLQNSSVLPRPSALEDSPHHSFSTGPHHYSLKSWERNSHVFPAFSHLTLLWWSVCFCTMFVFSGTAHFLLMFKSLLQILDGIFFVRCVFSKYFLSLWLICFFSQKYLLYIRKFYFQWGAPSFFCSHAFGVMSRGSSSQHTRLSAFPSWLPTVHFCVFYTNVSDSLSVNSGDRPKSHLFIIYFNFNCFMFSFSIFFLD